MISDEEFIPNVQDEEEKGGKGGKTGKRVKRARACTSGKQYCEENLSTRPFGVKRRSTKRPSLAVPQFGAQIDDISVPAPDMRPPNKRFCTPSDTEIKTTSLETQEVVVPANPSSQELYLAYSAQRDMLAQAYASKTVELENSYTVKKALLEMSCLQKLSQQSEEQKEFERKLIAEHQKVVEKYELQLQKRAEDTIVRHVAGGQIVVGQTVCVSLTDLLDFTGFRFCWLEGTVKQIVEPTEFLHAALFHVVLHGENKSVVVCRERLDVRIGADRGQSWHSGDQVLVLEASDDPDIQGWWQATVVDFNTKTGLYIVEWWGQYIGSAQRVSAHPNRIRRALTPF